MTTAARLRGSIAPLVTPFDAEDAIDYEALAELVDWHVEQGSHGVSVCGTTGEPSALTLEEREHMIERTAAVVAGRVPFVPGTGTNSLPETVRLTRVAERAGADGALVIVPYYNRPSQAGLLAYFDAVASAVELPIVIYNIPGRTAVNLAPETLARLRERHANIVGVKESNKDFEQASRVLHLCGRDFLLFSGIELLCYPMLAIGGAGHISATANLLPRSVAALYDHVAARRFERAIDLHYELLPLNEVLFLETNPGPLKWALGRIGRIAPRLRPPLAPPSPEHQRTIERTLEGYGLLAAGVGSAR